MNNKPQINELDIKRFNALAGHSRSPAAAYVSEELGWFTNEDETVLGLLLRDTVDSDYVAILMARDESRIFRCFDLQCSFISLNDAKAWLFAEMEKHTLQGLAAYPQGEPSSGVDLFAPVTAVEKQHPSFMHLAREDSFVPARAIINGEEILELTRHEMPIKWGSPLFTKLKKEYWKLPHVKGKALVFAIADFHDDRSMLWSSTALVTYLYGVYHDFKYDEDNKLVITPVKIDTHKRMDGKQIPSGFFFQPGSENVSAILSSASGTISKFNRLGRQAGFSHPDVIMIRKGTRHDHDPNASVPKLFQYIVDENSNETWAEGLSMFHNPNALHPVPKELFPTIGHHEFRDGQIVSYLPEFHPYGSVTLNMRKMRGDS